jgi:hypothetical protein
MVINEPIMWHQIPTHVTKIHKGWFISINKASKWNKHLRVSISPIVQPNFEYIKTLPEEIRSKITIALLNLPDKYTHTFEVANLYPLVYPWGEATNKAYIYINEKLGQFDVAKAVQEVKI